ncbi:MAG TPA: excinuclease ABC subunit UvrA, partial [Promineifilum sp.]
FPRPEADSIANLSIPVVVDQKRLGGGSHSTVGTITDIAPVLRLLFSRAGRPFVGYSNAFSFNDPQGMCPECNGQGHSATVDLDLFLDTSLSLNEGAILGPGYAVGKWDWSFLIQSGLFDNDKKLDDYSDEEMELLLYSPPQKLKTEFGGRTINLTFEGVVAKFTRKYIRQDKSTYSERTQKSVEPFITEGPCHLCHGARLSQAALSCRINGYNIAELSAMEIPKLIDVLQSLNSPVNATMIATLTERLQNLVDIGLEYLTLNRPTDTLSGGESQRVKIVKHLSSSLIDVMYIFDEPSIGLHPRDIHLMNELLQKLRDKGNTVLVVEHDPAVIGIADHVVDIGPRAGSAGGTIVYEGSFNGLLKSDTITGVHLKQTLPIKPDFRRASGQMPIRNARVNNLQNVSVDIPVGVLTVVTGVAGSGKSSLINQTFLPRHPDAIVIDQAPVGANSRSNPATYTGVLDDVRAAFARENDVSASLFSFNSSGACENCNGSGVIYTELGFLDGVKTPCEVCEGRRFKDEVLTYKLNGRSITDVLNMTVQEALGFFDMPKVGDKLQAMVDVGIGYLRLGQPLSTLSGGECQRIKLAGELHKRGSVYVMDEPTTGLHMSDISLLLAIMNRLVDAGNTVIVIEHNLDVIRNADWIIDMGPEGGSSGGRVIFEGTPQALLGAEHSLTARYLNHVRSTKAEPAFTSH